MSFKISDVGKFCAGLALTPEQQTEWLELANAALEQVAAEGGDLLEAEIHAIKVANARFRNEGAELSDPVHRAPVGKPYHFSFAELPAAASDEFQMVLPIGYFFNRWYGDIIITRTFCDLLVANFSAKILGNRIPFLDTNHDNGAANAWLKGMEARDDGLYVQWDWTDQGRELIAKRIYRYYSAELTQAMNVQTGKEVWPVLPAVALTNIPAMSTMPEAHLSDSPGAHGDADTLPSHKAGKITEDVMELNDVITFAKAAPEAERTQIALAAMPELVTLKTEVEGLRAANVQLSEQVRRAADEKKAKRKAEVIESALSEGRILPKDKEAWERRFDAAPDTIAEIIESLPQAVDLGERGTGDGGKPAVILSADEKAVAEEFGISEDEMRDGKPAKKA